MANLLGAWEPLSRLAASGFREDWRCAVFRTEMQQLREYFCWENEPYLNERLCDAAGWCISLRMALPRQRHLNVLGNDSLPSVAQGNEIAAT